MLGWAVLGCAVLCCAVLCCAVLCCAVLCCAVLCCAVLCCAVLCCAVLCCAVLRCAAQRATSQSPICSCPNRLRNNLDVEYISSQSISPSQMLPVLFLYVLMSQRLCWKESSLVHHMHSVLRLAANIDVYCDDNSVQSESICLWLTSECCLL